MSDEILYALTMPKWGMAMDEGTVTDWHMEEGAAVEAGADVLDVESTKIANGIEAKQAGVLRRRIAAVGDTLPVGGLLGVVAGPASATETVMVGDRVIRYLTRGDDGGLPVVLVHGFGGDLNTWMFNQPALAADRRVYALDLPGHGGSSKDVGDGGLAVLTDVLGGFMAALDIERAHLAGHSLGGAVVLAHARARPHSVASLSLVASAGLGRDINGGYIDGFVAAARRKDMKAVLPALFADPKLVSRQMVEDVLKAKRIDGATEALAALAAAQFPNGVQAVSLADPLAMPVQVIWGADDAIIPASHAGNLAGAKVTVLDAAGHMPHMEAAVAVNTLLTEFMAP